MKIHATTSLNLHHSKDSFLTNVKTNGKSVYSFPVEIDGPSRQQKDFCSNTLVPSTAFGSKLPFTCTLIPDDSNERGIVDQAFHATAKYKNGRPFCEVKVKELSNESILQMSKTELLMSLQVTLLGKDEISSSLRVHVLPAFYISKKENELTLVKPADVFTVTGVHQQLESLVVS